MSWSKVRQILFYLGLLMMVVSVALLQEGNKYLLEYLRSLNAGRPGDMSDKMRWLHYLWVARPIALAATVMVAFGRGWSRFCAVFAGIILFIVEVGSA